MSDDRAPQPFEEIAPQLVPGAIGAFWYEGQGSKLPGSIMSHEEIEPGIREARVAPTDDWHTGKWREGDYLMSVYDVTFPNGSVGSQQYFTLTEARQALEPAG